MEECVLLWDGIHFKCENLKEFTQLAQLEEDESLSQSINSDISDLLTDIEDAEFKNMLSGKDDSKNSILTIHSGAGGTEAQDWADMLMRMYLRWGEQNNFNMSILDILDGEGAGIKSVTIE
ncbi:MAG: peptide chain release factor 2, partial [Ignavibacteriales bacterium CG_4_9_14_3_um_filter_30_11]